jgi:hypothetical protein
MKGKGWQFLFQGEFFGVIELNHVMKKAKIAVSGLCSFLTCRLPDLLLLLSESVFFSFSPHT